MFCFFQEGPGRCGGSGGGGIGRRLYLFGDKSGRGGKVKGSHAHPDVLSHTDHKHGPQESVALLNTD